MTLTFDLRTGSCAQQDVPSRRTVVPIIPKSISARSYRPDRPISTVNLKSAAVIMSFQLQYWIWHATRFLFKKKLLCGVISKTFHASFGLDKPVSVVNLESVTMTLTSELQTWVLHPTYRLIKVSNCASYFKILRWKKKLWVLRATHFFKINNCAK